MSQEYWYRVEDTPHGSVDEFGDLSGVRVVVSVRKYLVLRHTAKGAWLHEGWGRERFVLRNAHKRWACPTEEEAIASFRARKERQIRILSGQLSNARAALAATPAPQGAEGEG
jgi:hypothetical protein